MLTLHRWAYELQRVTGQGGGHHKESTAKCPDPGEPPHWGGCRLWWGLEWCGNRPTSLPKTRIMRRLQMIEGTTYYTGHSYGAPLWRNIGSRDSLHIDVLVSLLPFQLSRMSSWESLAVSVNLPRAFRISCFSHEIINMESYQHHHWLHGRYSGSLLLQSVSMHGNYVDFYFL